jgi:hypothetical protein
MVFYGDELVLQFIFAPYDSPARELCTPETGFVFVEVFQ